MSHSHPFSKIAVLGVASLLGQTGTLSMMSGVAPPIGELVDLVFDRRYRNKLNELRTLCGCLADELEHVAPKDEGTREAVRLEA
ncbi:MAG: hypothetical protein ACFB6S_03565 [Geminicoccaceae bacterium]